MIISDRTGDLLSQIIKLCKRKRFVTNWIERAYQILRHLLTSIRNIFDTILCNKTPTLGMMILKKRRIT